MSENTNELITVEGELLDEPGEGFQSRNVIYTIAKRLISHTAGKIVGGYEKVDGRWVPVKNSYATGSLILTDAMYAVEYGLTRGLNPYGHLHLWYHRSSQSPTPQLIIDIDYKILKGWAEWRSPFRSKAFVMTAEERQTYGLQPADLGAVVYNILDEDVHYLHQYQLEFIRAGMKFAEAQRLAHQGVAKSEGIGIVKAAEMKSSSGKNIPPPKGRTWQWRAETRAFRDATRRSHGEPPPAQVKQYAAGQGLAIEERHLPLMAESSYPADIPPEDQQRYLIAADVTQSPNNQHDLALVNGLMRDNGDDDPLDLSSEEPEEAEQPQAPEVPQELAELKARLADEASQNPRQGKATDHQVSILNAKLDECFAGEADSLDKAIGVLSWLFAGAPLTFAQAQALGHSLLLDQDEETGDYPLNQKFIPLARGIYRQYQLEQGQLELL